MAIRNYLESFRESAGLSQQEVADRCGVSQTLINGIERGTRNASEALIVQLSEIFHCTADELIHGPKATTKS